MSNPQDLIDAGLATIAADCEITVSQREITVSQREMGKRQVNFQRYNQGGVKREIVHVAQDVEEESCYIEEETVETEEVERENEGVYYICQVCAKSFESKEDVDLHLATQECKGMEKEVKEMYECGECKILCTSMNSLASHMMVHKQKVIVVRHGFKEHLTRVGFKCTICHKVLGSKGNLVKHQIIHTGIRPYKCSFCSKEFSLKGNRDKHELIHSDRRAHQCQICSKKFTLKGNLQQHILTHSTVKFFRCYLCDKEFTLKGNLDKHIKRHANGMGYKEIQKVDNTGEPSKKRRKSSSQNRNGQKESANIVEDYVVDGDYVVEVTNETESTRPRTENSGLVTVDIDSSAEQEDLNKYVSDYVKGVTADNVKTEEEVVDDPEEEDDDAVAEEEEEEVNDYVKGVTLDNDKVEEQVVSDQGDNYDDAHEDIQNL